MSLVDVVYIWVFTLVGAGMIGMTLQLSRLLRRKNPTDAKLMTYECGNDPTGEPWIQFRIRYYIFALLLVVFDIELIFLYPWAVVFRQLGLVAFVEAAIFLVILLMGLLYAWRKGALRWM